MTEQKELPTTHLPQDGKQQKQKLAHLAMTIVTKGEIAQRGIEMTKRKPGLTLDEHLEQAITFRLIKEKLDDLKNECCLKFPANHRIVRSLKKAKENLLHARHHLDDEYHKVCGDEGFSKHGHVYYSQLPTVQSKTSDVQSPDREG